MDLNENPCFVSALSLMKEWADELFSLASNLLAQNMGRESCLEKA